MAGLVGVPTRTAYSAAKHAVIGFCDALRVEVAGDGVSVTVVCPDFVESQIHRRALGPDGKPLGENPMAGSKIMTADRCAAIMVRAIERRERLVLTSARGRAARWLKLISPGNDRPAGRQGHPREGNRGHSPFSTPVRCGAGAVTSAKRRMSPALQREKENVPCQRNSSIENRKYVK